MLELVFDQALPAYREFHRDLLFHQTDASLFRPFFVGRVCEAVLRQGPPWNEPDRIVPRDHRRSSTTSSATGPLPRSNRRSSKPYKHEFVRPIPLFIRGAGISCGPGARGGRRRPASCWKRPTTTCSGRPATRSRQLLDELAIDPRAYDFDHPANKRPNYHFGQWDPHHIDNQGRYRRFVVQQVTLDALMRRLTDAPDIPADELLFEAAAVLAGTILMASGISGEGPATFDSTVTLSKLLPKIARYRDDFYERLFATRQRRARRAAARSKRPSGGSPSAARGST